MSRMVSFVVLVAILLVIAGLFFRVMANFLLPMFLALLLAVMCAPLHRWFIAKCQGRDRLAAGLTTAAILLVFLVPLLLILLQAISEGVAIYHAVNDQPEAAAEESVEQQAPAEPEPQPGLQDKVSGSLSRFGGRLGLKLSPAQIDEAINQKIQDWMTPVMVGTAQFVGSLAIGLFVMVVSLYYFLADGPNMVRVVMHLSPLDDRYEEQLIDEFETISRAVVLASVTSAIVQGLLAGIGYYFTGLDTVFLLMALTMLFAMVPFVGAAAIWVPVCLYVYFVQERVTAAVLLAIYGTCVISAADNVIKPIILHGRSNLHPLLALLSVLGGVQALGPIGIFVGPMVVAFLHALLNMLHTELAQMSGASAPAESGSGDDPSSPPESPEASPEASPAGDAPTSPEPQA